MEKVKDIQVFGKPYIIKHFNARERAEIGEKAATIDEKTGKQKVSLALVRLWMVADGVVTPKMTLAEVEAMDGAIFDALFTAINDFNTAPLSP
jgi:hypothetical protein